ncbi:NucA/NucB deoxyribonuclease domain-containing protein [Streptomyces roseirectus]|uniref:NucA/NucB deoxyribonuclease domain-containing protein n=1 Tax=Streptomyces roseirectus TaxID=2768066 RepID=UPI001FED1946|nr:hypothetical protein [Streptomyces roseirectus]
MPTLRTASLAADCARLESQIESGALAVENGKTNAACIKPGGKGEVTARDLSALADRTPVPLPDYCYDLATGDGTWWYTRTDACAISVWTLNVVDVRTGRLTGQLSYIQADLLYTGADAPYWAHQVAIDKTDGWGTIGGTTVSGGGTCTGACTLASGDIDFPSQPVNDTGLAFGDILPKTTVTAAGAKGEGRTKVNYRFANPTWTVQPLGVTTEPPFNVRCDNAVPGTTAVGCVVPAYPAVHVVSLTGRNPNYARHIQEAQTSGLPGAYPNGQPLRRLTDATNRDKNGDTACPQFADGGYPRPTGYSCDEYPFRSTWQGAYTGSVGQPTPYPGRTFSWCQISALSSRVGPNGWSACMIPVSENSSGGSLLNRFYIDNRVIENDPFYVWITT